MTDDVLRPALGALAGRHVVVVGDVMVDEYVWGDVSRISPDAPVQVVDVRRRTHAIGGAGNVAHNVTAAGGRATLVAVVGDDDGGRTFADLTARSGLEAGGLVVDGSRRTTVKTRVLARGQQVVRLDEESRTPLGDPWRSRVLDAARRAIPHSDALLLSDYSKGVLDRAMVEALVDAAHRSRPDMPVIVDPKCTDMSVYRGCTVVTPNLKEAEAATGLRIASDDDLREAASRIRAASASPWVVVTLGERGMALSGPDGELSIVPARAREVYDVTGAGDTVLGYLGLGWAARLDPLLAVELANLAAGVAVTKVGTTAVTPQQILAAAQATDASARKSVGRASAQALVEHERSLGRRIVFTNGCFDLLHAGHVHLLEQARRLGDVLVVAVNSDESVRRLKGPGRPVVGQDDRVKMLCALDAVDVVVVFDEDTPLALIELVRPDVLVKGGDYAKDRIVGASIVESRGGRVETVPLLEGRSTTTILSRLRRDDG